MNKQTCRLGIPNDLRKQASEVEKIENTRDNKRNLFIPLIIRAVAK